MSPLETSEEPKGLRLPEDPIFHGLVPDEFTLERIAEWESGEWTLMDTRAGDDPSAPDLEKELKTQHGEGNVLHYNLSATQNGSPVGIHCFFIKAEAA